MNASKVTPRPAAVNPRGRQLLIWLAVLIFAVVAFKLFLPHENRYEKLARDVTVALQNNDVDAVKKYQNAETATRVTRGVVGREADRLAPYGKLKSVKETTPNDGPERTHEFTVAFDKGTIRETIKFDPDMKIVAFHYVKGAQ